ncbi:MFS transporter [Corynebacterium aquatimens]
MLVVLRESQGLSTLLVNAAYGIYAIGLFPCLIAGGLIADRFGSRPVVLVGSAIAALGNLALMIWSSPGVLLTARFVIGLGVGLVVSAGTAWAGRLRGTHGTTAAGIFLTSGFMLGPVASGILAFVLNDAQSLVVPYIVSIVLSVAAIAFSLVVGDATQHTVTFREITSSDTTSIDGEEAAAEALGGTPDKQAEPAPIERSSVKALATSVPVAMWVFASMTSAIIVLAGRVGQHFESSAFMPGVGAFMAFGSGLIIQALGRKFEWGPRSGVIGALCSVVGMTLVALGGALPPVWLFPIAAVFLGLAYGLCLRDGLMDVDTFTPPHKRGGVIGIYYVATYIGFGYPPLIEWLDQYVGPSLPFWVLAALALTSAIIRTTQIRSGYLNRK